MIPAHTLIWIWLLQLRALMLPQAVPVLTAFALGIVFERYMVVPVRRKLAEPAPVTVKARPVTQ